MNANMMSWEQAVLQLRRDPAQSELVQACFYDDPPDASARRYFESTEWAALESLLPSSKGDVLDLGAGRGIVAYAFARSGWRVAAAEPDPSDVVGAGAIRELARTTAVSIDVVESSGEKLPFPDGSFDVAHCRAVLHHAKDLPVLCSEVSRVLRPGGLMIATREHVISRESDRPAFFEMHPLHRFYGGENAYRISAYTSAITSAGLKLEKVLNPFETDINLFPGTKQEFKERIARRLSLPRAVIVPDVLLRILGQLSNAPGRLYTFVARKPST
ncbi:MAG: class I SAM-dependent methyltransferase [Afipia sp.]